MLIFLHLSIRVTHNWPRNSWIHKFLLIFCINFRLPQRNGVQVSALDGARDSDAVFSVQLQAYQVAALLRRHAHESALYREGASGELYEEEFHAPAARLQTVHRLWMGARVLTNAIAYEL